MSVGDKTKSMLLKPLVKAAVASAAIRMVYGDVRTKVFGQEMSSLTFGAGVGLTSELIAEVVNQWVLPQLEENNKARHFDSLLVSLGLSAGSFAILPVLVAGSKPTGSEVMTNMGMGALVEVVASYVHDNAFGGVGQTPLFSLP